MKKMSKDEWMHINCKLVRIERKIDSVIRFFGIQHMEGFIDIERLYLGGGDEEVEGVISANKPPILNKPLTSAEGEEYVRQWEDRYKGTRRKKKS